MAIKRTRCPHCRKIIKKEVESIYEAADRIVREQLGEHNDN